MHISSSRKQRALRSSFCVHIAQKLPLYMATLTAASLAAVPAFAQTATWNGSQSSDWQLAANWDGNAAPISGASGTVHINALSSSTIATGVVFHGSTLNIASISGVDNSLHLLDNSDFRVSSVNIGTIGIGKMSIVDSTLVAANGVRIGSAGYGHLSISGSSSYLELTSPSSHLNIGDTRGGYGRVDILSGARVNVRNVSLGNLNGSGDLIVSGQNSTLTIEGRDLSAAGYTGNVFIEVSNGGLIDIIGDTTRPQSRGLLQLGSNAGTLTELLITGAGSQIITTGDGLIAEFGTVSALVEDHGKLNIGNNLIIGVDVGDLTIKQNGTVIIQKDTALGINNGHGTLTLTEGGEFHSIGEIYIAINDNSKGDLNIGSASGQNASEAGLLDVSRINFGTGNGRIVFNHTADEQSGAYQFNPVMEGAGTIEHYAGSTRFSALNNSLFTGSTTVFGGVLQVDGQLGGTMNVETNGRLQGVGTVGSTVHKGVISPGNSIGTLTIDGDYLGSGGILEIETVLGDDSSSTDMLIITGNASGHTNVVVTNVNGPGRPTHEGIRIVEIQGQSAGNFSLTSNYIHENEPAVVAGAYAYKLYHGSTSSPSDGDWYLRSTLIAHNDPTPPPTPQPLYQPGAPIYEAYPQTLLALNGMQSLQQRVGNRAWNDNASTTQKADAASRPDVSTHKYQSTIEGSGIWGRIIGSHAHIKPASSALNVAYKQDMIKLQAGADALLVETTDSALIGGITAHYTRGIAHTSTQRLGTGKIITDGFGFGVTLTWYSENGFYIDGQAQATWYSSDLHSNLAGISLTKGNNGFGYALSLESGRKFAIDPIWSLTPQVQLAYSNVHFNSFRDHFPNGAQVSIGLADSLEGRFGLAVNHDNTWHDNDGLLHRTHIYGIANLYYEFLNGTHVDVSAVQFENRKDRFWGGIGAGGSYNWNNDKYSIYGEALITTSFNDFGKSHNLKGQIGLRMKW